MIMMTTKGNQGFTYDQANRITNTGYDYDDNGNLISDGIFNYTYDAENKLIEVKDAGDDSTIATYTYYYNGLRKSKTVNGVTTYFHWDAFGNLTSENDSNNNSFNYYYDPGGNLIGFIRNGDSNQKYIYHTDAHGNVVSVTDSTNTIQAQYTYDPWGTQTSYTGTLTQPLRYAGYYLDTETGMYYLKSRYYSPSMGRFLTKDGYGYISNSNPQTLNLYTYCNNNPVNAVDPSGTDAYIIVDNDGLSHMSALVEADDGDWYYYYFGQSNVILQAVDSSVIDGINNGDLSALNDWVHANTNYEGDYDDFAYYSGNYQASYNYYYNNLVNYQRYVQDGGTCNIYYDLWNCNCATTTIYGISLGTNTNRGYGPPPVNSRFINRPATIFKKIKYGPHGYNVGNMA